ncbi:MAG: hypothetical protein ABSF95_23660 [Verrucomicrobiota bacterium]|jgi:hypothetical protein
MNQLVGLTEEARIFALEQFRSLQPHLQQHRPLRLVAAPGAADEANTIEEDLLTDKLPTRQVPAGRGGSPGCSAGQIDAFSGEG